MAPKAKKLERKTGFEPATATLARWSSTGLSYFRSCIDRIDAKGRILDCAPRVRQDRASLSPVTVSSQRLNPVPMRRAAFDWR